MRTAPTSERAIESTQETKRSRGWLWIVVAFIGGLLIGAVVVWQVVDDAESSDVVEVSAEVEQEIAELVDSWQAVWREGDGDAAVALFTADGRYVGYLANERQDGPDGEYLEGWSGEELKAGIERHGGGWGSLGIVDLLIIPQTDHYDVAYFVKSNPTDTDGSLGLLHVVDEEGTLKIRYAERWNSMGWSRITDELPYQPVSTGG